MKPSKLPIEFISQGFILRGVLHLPETETSCLVVGSHGLEGSKESAKQLLLSQLLVQNNIAFFRFDHRGCGQSDGNFLKDTSLEKRTMDYIAAVAYVLSIKKGIRRLALFGSSMGGATCINAWESLSKMRTDLCGAVICSAPVRSRSIEKIPVQTDSERPALPLSFFTENLMFNITDKAAGLDHVLIFHGDADDVVPVSNAHDIYERANQPKKLIIHKNGDHQMSSRKDQQQFEVEAVAWYQKCFSQGSKVPS